MSRKADFYLLGDSPPDSFAEKSHSTTTSGDDVAEPVLVVVVVVVAAAAGRAGGGGGPARGRVTVYAHIFYGPSGKSRPARLPELKVTTRKTFSPS
jgi:hypothetical protein